MSTPNKAQATVQAPWLNEPSLLEEVMDIVSGKKSPKYEGATLAFTLRMPTYTALLIEAMFSNTKGISRNELICQLLELALQEVRENLPEDIGDKVLQFVSVSMTSSHDKLLAIKRKDRKRF